ncbi:hypothetical protein [Rufibacter latericius]|uniref:Uncharacterized protein n=1 Tax=Rufibacter latericius TaxID=2487040 RepID=A0A3M9MA05_9BACT|nr:hypothetical protein [Rufibacter latericius]RNI22045.1 hypothetical protein EFB08_23215 [Rufibacter latericius]
MATTETKPTPEQEIALLKEQLPAKDATIAEKEQALVVKDSIIDEQLQALDDAEASKDEVLPVINVDGVQYQLTSAKFQHPEKDAVVTAVS